MPKLRKFKVEKFLGFFASVFIYFTSVAQTINTLPTATIQPLSPFATPQTAIPDAKSLTQGERAETDEQNTADHSGADRPFIGPDRIYAYRNFGPAYWQPVGFWNYPVASETFKYIPLSEHSIPLNKNGSKNVGADDTGWVPIPVNENSVYYRAEYLMKDLGVDINACIENATAYYRQSSTRRQHWEPNDYSSRGKDDVRNKEDDLTRFQSAKITMVTFPASRFHLKYFPGRELVWDYKGAAKWGRLASPREGVVWNSDYSSLGLKEYANLTGIFKGTFDNEDNLRGGRLPGLIIDGKIVDYPMDELATVALYKDGSYRVGSLSDIGDLSKVKMLRQNEYLILHNGKLNPEGAYPFGWNRFPDDIMRSYLAMTADRKYFAYVWTVYAHPSMLAAAMLKLGFSDVMLLDIHPAIGADFAKPMALSNDPKYHLGFFNFKNLGSYALIPRESQVMTGVLKVKSALARSYHGRMKWEPAETIRGSTEDFFGVYMNDVQSEQSTDTAKNNVR